MPDILSILSTAQIASQNAIDRQGRVEGSVLSIVTDNNDPENRRRIKVADPVNPGLSTPWLRRLLDRPFVDPPVPSIGQTVIVFYQEDDPALGWYLSCANDTNPPFDKTSAQNDHYEKIPGKFDQKIDGTRNIQVEQEDTERSEENRVISVGKQLTLVNDAGAGLTLHESGAIVVNDAFGNKLVLGGVSGSIPGISTDFLWSISGTDCVLDLNYNDFRIINASNVTIANKSIATVGAVDNTGDILVNRGW